MATNLFITLTNTNTGYQHRISVDNIIAYGQEKLVTTNEVVTMVYIDHPDLSVIFINQTPEQLDKILSDCYVTVRHEQ